MLPKELLEILACPKCKGELEYRPGNNGEGEVLICHSCKLVYEVIDGIPNMLIEEAKPLEE
ncbi:MAG: Trm112 family protein [Candidatus Sumerlaeaceae bacterium]|nr:Trm112 family protein [Candidatus Sumerlaeaceae bacterium]